MKNVWYSRRTFIAFISLTVLALLGLVKGFDTSMSVAAIAVGFCGANAWEGRGGQNNPTKKSGECSDEARDKKE